MQNAQMLNKRPRADEAIADEQNGGMDPAQIGILQLNNMTYKLEPDLAIVVQRQTQSSFFTSQAYAPGATMTAIVNSGSGFVNLRNSYLILEVRNDSINVPAVTTQTNAWFGDKGGSACNLINRVQIIAKNGVVLERVDNANVLSACKVSYQYSDSWRKSVGSLMGVSQPVVPTYTGTGAPTAPSTELNWISGNGHAALAATVPGRTIRFMIPLYVFSTLCDSMNALCPWQLLSGSRFEILLENAKVAMVDTTALKSLNYAVTACRLEFETYVLTDAVQKVLNQISATQGLEVVTSTTQNTQSQRTSNQITVDVARSCSRALSVIYKERVPSGAAAVVDGFPADSLFDSMASPPIIAAINMPNAPDSANFTNIPQEWQVRAGQLYFPQSSIRGSPDVLGLAENELYAQTLRGFQKLYPGSMGQFTSCGTSLRQFRGDLVNSPGYKTAGGAWCFAVDLQRSNILTSGIPLSNSRQLSIQYKTQDYKAPTGSFSYLVDVFLTYQVVIRTFLTQCVLEV